MHLNDNHRDNHRDSPGQPESLARVCGVGGCWCQKISCTRTLSKWSELDSWWCGTMKQVRKSGIWAGLSDNQGGHACTWGSATTHVLVRVEGRKTCSLVTLSSVSPRGERDLATGTCVSPVQRHCEVAGWAGKQQPPSFTSLGQRHWIPTLESSREENAQPQSYGWQPLPLTSLCTAGYRE